jgi:hypothetical protein
MFKTYANCNYNLATKKELGGMKIIDENLSTELKGKWLQIFVAKESSS